MEKITFEEAVERLEDGYINRGYSLPMGSQGRTCYEHMHGSTYKVIQDNWACGLIEITDVPKEQKFEDLDACDY